MGARLPEGGDEWPWVGVGKSSVSARTAMGEELGPNAPRVAAGQAGDDCNGAVDGCHDPC